MKPPSGKDELRKNESGKNDKSTVGSTADGKTPAQRSQSSLDLSPRKRRKITPFLCKQMLYDYATGMLDDSRHQAVTEVLKDTKDCRDQLSEIEAGLALCKSLAAVDVNPEKLAEIQKVQSWRTDVKKYRSWRSWPEALRWSIGTMGVTLIIAGIFSLAPWKKIHWASKKAPTTIEVAQIPNLANSSGDTEPQNPQQPGASGGAATVEMASGIVAQADQGTDEDQESSGDLEEGRQASAAVKSSSGAAHTKAAAHTDTSGDDDSEGGLSAQALPGKKSQPPAQSSTAATLPGQNAVANGGSKSVIAQNDAAESAGRREEVTGVGSQKSTRPGKAQSFVYRAFMNLNDLDDLTPKIAQNIKELGGERAGEVELGWRKGGRGSYFHFSVPESNQEKLLEKLRGYGPVRISKDPHPRVMPDGVVRFILWIEPTRK